MEELKEQKYRRTLGKQQREDGCCEFDIDIKNKGTIYINCPTAPAEKPRPPLERPEECPPPSRAKGACIPLALGSKPKKSLQAKLQPLIENSPVPSVLAATILHQARRFQLGRSPGNPMEASVFEVLGGLSPELKNTLSCAMETFDGLSKRTRESIFAQEVFSTGDQALDPKQVADLVVGEIEGRVAKEVFNHEGCTVESPGLPRPVFSTVNGGNFLGFIPSICRVNGLRTFHFQPRLGVGDYEPDELQQNCTPQVADGEVQFNCEVLTEDCPGHQVGDVAGPCLRVPEVSTGDIVVLEGFNFFNVEAKVHLNAKPPGTATEEIETFVCGDQETPATEEINGEDMPINDCRVHDRLTFQIPDELPVGIYEVRVVVPNNTGVEGTDPEFVSEEIFIRVVPPETAQFQIASEELHAKKETSPASFGSDEVAIRFLTVPILSDSTELEMNAPINFRFGNVDSGDTRDMSRVLIQGSGLAGVSIAIVGFEVDSEDAFENQIDNFTDAFVEILKRVWNAIKDFVKGGVAAIVKKYGVKGAIGVAIAAVVALGIIAIVALWAPADLIIEDSIGLSSLDLAILTSANFPLPEVAEFTSVGEVDVKIVPVSKGVQYRERREYRSDDEDSEYHISLRYNRLA